MRAILPDYHLALLTAGAPLEEIERVLTPEEIPGDWYRHVFDELYLAVDQCRNPPEKTQREVDWVLRLLPRSHALRILDLCCGYGRHAIELAKRGHSVVGVDISTVLLNKAELDAQKAGVRVELRNRDMRHLPDEVFDAAICMHTSLGYFKEDEENAEVLASIHRVLGDHGVFVFDQLDISSNSVRQRQRAEGFTLPCGTSYRKLSVFDMKRLLWFGAYVYQNRSERIVRPFHIQIQVDAAKKMRGAYQFAVDGLSRKEVQR